MKLSNLFGLLFLLISIPSIGQFYKKELETGKLPQNPSKIYADECNWDDLIDFIKIDERIKMDSLQLFYNSSINNWNGKIIYSIDTSKYFSENKIFFNLKDIVNYNELLSIYRMSDSSGKRDINKKLYGELTYLNHISFYVPPRHLKEYEIFLEADQIKFYSFKSENCDYFYSIEEKEYCDRIKVKKTVKNPSKEIIHQILKNDNYIFLSSHCYIPRDAIEFYKNGIPIGFMEICFECGQVVLYNLNSQKKLSASMKYSFGGYLDKLVNE